MKTRKSAKRDEAPAIRPGALPQLDIASRRLANGLRLASVRLPGFSSVAVGVFVRAGSRHEPAELNGISHFLEHMAFKGTARRSARDISFEAERLGASINAYTAKDHTAYYLLGLAEHLDPALDILADVVLHSGLPEEEIERERSVILQELGDAADDPQDLVQDEFDLKAFPGQPLGRPILGRPRVIRSLTREILQPYLQRHYTAANLVVVGVGGLSHEHFAQSVAQHFSGVAAGVRNAVQSAQYRGGYRHLDEDFGQVSVALGWPTPGRDDPDHAAHELLGELFGAGMSSPLFQAVREQRGLAYTVDALTDLHPDCGIFQVWANVAPRNLRQFLDVTCDELLRLVDRIDPADLERARNQQRASLRMSCERPQSLCESVARELLLHDRITTLDEVARRFESLEVSTLQDRLARMLEQTPTLSVVGRSGRGDPYHRVVRRLAQAA